MCGSRTLTSQWSGAHPFSTHERTAADAMTVAMRLAMTALPARIPPNSWLSVSMSGPMCGSRTTNPQATSISGSARTNGSPAEVAASSSPDARTVSWRAWMR